MLHDHARYSDRVCNPCGRKIRSLGQLFEFVKAGTTPTLNSVSVSAKRILATPEKASPSWRKSKVVRLNSPTAKTLSPHSAGKSRKSLAFGGGISSITLSSTQKEDEMSKLNVDDLPQTGLQVKVVYMIPSGTVTTRAPQDEPTKNLVKNVACENWREVANAILGQKELAPEINIAIRKAVSKEFSDYLKCESMLLARNPDELAGFSNKLFMEEVRIHCPVWFNCQLGASGLSSKEEAVGGRANSMTLASSTLARLRNPQSPESFGSVYVPQFHRSSSRLSEHATGRKGGHLEKWHRRESRCPHVGQRGFTKTSCLATPGCKQAASRELRLFLYKGARVLKTLFNEEVAKASLNVNIQDCMQIVIKRLEGTKLPLYK